MEFPGGSRDSLSAYHFEHSKDPESAENGVTIMVTPYLRVNSEIVPYHCLALILLGFMAFHGDM